MSARSINIRSHKVAAVGIRSSSIGKLQVVKFEQVSVFTFLDCSNTSVIDGNASVSTFIACSVVYVHIVDLNVYARIMCENEFSL